ncbi:MAG: hypothetical protein HY767_03315, partial [Candidatus Omnitrophica bacterium]|nr:hypothetical protein [Candidatus Omnitrophota bacterium]
ETRTWTVYYLYRDHFYNPEVKKILNYFEAGSMPAMSRVAVGAASVLLAASMVLFPVLGVGIGAVLLGALAIFGWGSTIREKHFDAFKEMAQRSVLRGGGTELTAEIYATLPLILDNARKGEYGFALKDQKLRKALWENVHHDHGALLRLKEMRASLIPSVELLTAAPVERAEAEALLAQITALSEPQAIWNALETALTGKLSPIALAVRSI